METGPEIESTNHEQITISLPINVFFFVDHCVRERVHFCVRRSPADMITPLVMHFVRTGWVSRSLEYIIFINCCDKQSKYLNKGDLFYVEGFAMGLVA